MQVGNVLTLAARAAGISGQGQPLSQDMTNLCWDALDAMAGQWAAKRWLVYHLVDSTVSPCTGARSYTVGPGGDFNLSIRPTDIESAYVSMYAGTPRQIDTTLEIVKAREDYNKIAMKSLTTFPQYLYYDNAFPLGTAFAWPIPSSLYSLTITCKMPLPSFSDQAADINLPAEYQEALVYNLAVRLRALYQLPLDPVIVSLAKASLGTIRAVNTQIERLQIPSAAGRGGRFNVYSGQ